MTEPAALIAAYLDGPTALRRAVAGLAPEQLTARPVAGKWSIGEVVCHLVDSEQAWCHRMKRVIAEDRPLLIGYDETRFVATLACAARPIAEELDLLDAMRRQMAFILRALPTSAWSRQGVHSERGLMSLADLLRAEADHIPHHLAPIREKRRALGLGDGE